MQRQHFLTGDPKSLNESPSEKEGKCGTLDGTRVTLHASMKVPPKRKGNVAPDERGIPRIHASMKVPPKRKGNLLYF